MPALIKPDGPILVTGATGYIGTWIISVLLKRGITVHAAIRTPGKGQHLLNIFAPYYQSQKLKLVIVGDISEPGAFDNAVGGISGIIHTASPVGQPLGDPEEMIRPAVEGVRSLLKSALKYNKELLKRIIIISSCAAIAHSSPNDLITVSEEDWNDEPVQLCNELGEKADGILKYVASKVLAERLAWEWYSDHRAQIDWDLCVLCPPWVFGPAIHEVADIKAINPSFRRLHSAVTEGVFGSYDGDDAACVPGHGWVDVRDVAKACVTSLIDVEGAGGERIIVCEGGESPFVWNDWVRAMESGKAGLEGEVRERKSGVHFDTAKERRILGMRWKGMEETLRDQLKCFEERGWN